MRKYTERKTLVRFAVAAIVLCACTGARAQINTVTEFFEKYLHIDTTKVQGDPRIHARLNFSAANILTTRSDVKVNNDGFEDYTRLGFAQRFGVVRAKVTYNLHRFSYSSWEDQTENVAVDVSYRSLRFRHLQMITARINSFDLPCNLSAAHIAFSFSQTYSNDVVNSIDAYRFASNLNRLKVSATWKDIGTGVWSDFSTEYRPVASWLMRYTYSNDGIDTQRRFRSEYSGTRYRLTGEYAAMTDLEDQTHISSAIGIKTETKLAALSLRFEHDGYIDSSMLFFKVESHNVF